MATGFNTQVGNGEYRLQFETDNREYYLLMQSTARRCVDGAQAANDKQAEYLLNEINRRFDEQNKILEKQNRMLETIIELM